MPPAPPPGAVPPPPQARGGAPAKTIFGMPALSIDDALGGDGPTSGAAEIDLSGGDPAPDDLPVPAADLPTPAVDLPTPAGELPTPVGDLRAVESSVDDLDLPGDADGPAARLEDAHTAEPAGPDLRLPRGPKALERPSLSQYKKPLVAAAAVLVLAAGGAIGWSMLAGGEEGSAAPSRNASETAAAGPARPRSPAVLALLAEDRPPALREAAETAKAEADLVGAAEASLLLHLRYGPDTVLLGQATSWLSSYENSNEAHVARVLALGTWAQGDPAAAAAKLPAEGPRVDLYRGYLAYERRAYEEAGEAARAAAKADPKDLGAVWLAHAVAVAVQGAAALPALEKTVADHPEHPRLGLLLAEAYARNGRLLAAARTAAKVDTTDAGAGFAGTVALLRGRIAARQGLRTEALMRFEQAKEVLAGDPRPVVELVRVFLSTRDIPAAKGEIELAKKALSNAPELLLAEADLAIATGHGDEALALLAEAEERLPADARVALRKGRVYAMRMALDEAKAAFSAARSADPRLAEASVELARLYARLRRYDEALAVLAEHDEQLAEIAGAAAARSALQVARAQILAQQGRDEDAEAALDRAVELDPGNEQARLARARRRLSARATEAATKDLAYVFEHAGSVPGLAELYGPILLRRGDAKALAALLGDSLDDPRAPADLLLLGARLRLREGKLDAALGLADRVLERDPNHWAARLVRGRALLAKGDPEGALLELQRARPTEPNAELELWTGRALEANERADEAFAHYRRAVELDPNDGQARVAYGAALAARGAAKEALAQLRPILEGKGAPSAEAYVALGRAYRDLGRIDDAVAAFRKARLVDPSLKEAAYWEGRILAERNKHAAAVVALERAVRGTDTSRPWVPLAYRLLGRSYAELGKRGLARKAYETFLSIAPPNDPGRAEATRRLRDL